MSLRSWIPPREYLLNELVARVPWTALRMRGYERLGVRFEAPGTNAILLGTDVHAPRRIEIGRGTIVGRSCLLDARGGIRLGRNVNVSSYSLLITGTHDPYDDGFAGFTEPIAVGDRAWIASRATILAGVTIGAGAVVAAGAVVNRDVEPFTIVGGVPAKSIGERPDSIDYELGYRRSYV